MNPLEKAVNEKMSRMEEGSTARFLGTIGKLKPADVTLQIGRYVEGGTLVMLATVNGQRLGTNSDASVRGLLNISDHYKQTYLNQEWRQEIKSILNQHKAEVLAIWQ